MLDGRSKRQKGALTFDVSPETLAAHQFRLLSTWAALLNLEHPMRLEDRLGGHLVTGHVDGVGIVHSIKKKGDFTFFTFRARAAFGISAGLQGVGGR